MTPFWMYQSAFTLQLASLALFFAYAAFPRRVLALSASSVLAVAVALQLAFTVLLALRDRAVPLGNAFEALNFFALLFALMTLALEWRWRMGLLGAFLSPFSSLFLLMGVRFEHKLPVEVADFGGLFLLLHVGFPMAAFALFTAAAGFSLAYLVEDRRLKRAEMGEALYTLPPLAELEKAAGLQVAWGLLLMVLGLAAGMAKDFSGAVERFKSDSMAALGLLILAFYGGLQAARASGLRGRRFALLSFCGFLALFFGFYLVNIYFGGHGGVK